MERTLHGREGRLQRNEGPVRFAWLDGIGWVVRGPAHRLHPPGVRVLAERRGKESKLVEVGALVGIDRDGRALCELR